MQKIYDDKFTSIEINGLLCYDIVEVLINLMEHEITHLLLFIYNMYKDDVKSGHNSQFKDLVYNMYRHTKITHDLLTGDVEQYKEHQENASKELKIGMTIQCKKESGIVIKITPKYILYKVNDKVKACKFNQYTISNNKYEPYQKHLEKLKNKIKVGVEVKFNKYYGPVTKITEDRVYFKDENSSRLFWCLFDFVELL